MRALRLSTAGALCTVLLAGGLAACGGRDEGGRDGVASLDDRSADASDDDPGDGGRPEATDAEKEDAMLEFAQCMRDHGIDMEDPQLGEDGGMIIRSSRVEGPGEGGGVQATDEAEMEAADEACSPIVEDVFGERKPPSPEEQAEMRDEMLEFAQCMRDHGVDMPDPEFSDGGVSMSIGDGLDPGSDEFQAAQEECGGTGGGQGGMAIGGDDEADEDEG